MISRKIETFLPFVLIAVAVAVALVFALHPPAARSEENEDGEDAGSDNTDCGEYGIPPEEIDDHGPRIPLFSRREPVVPLKDLPPMPPLFGNSEAAQERYRKAREDWEKRFSPEEREEIERKMEELKNRKSPFKMD